MRQVECWARWTSALLFIAPLLEGCASPSQLAPVAQTSPLTGRFTTGTVISVRNIDSGDDEGAVVQILAALGQVPLSNRDQAVEIVIRRQDNTVTSIVQQQQPGQSSFVPGERVAIVEAAATIIRPE
jgi:outer membrane lipoprotein SlyB